jgi:hypothetical protein
MCTCRFVLFVASALMLTAGSAASQSLPDGPVTFGDGRVVLAGDVSAALAADDPGFFNYGSYEQSTLRGFRAGLSAEVRAHRRVSFLAEVRTENLRQATPLAAYARWRPFDDHRIVVQAGRIPPTFGRSSRAAYQRQDALVGDPLAYQYLTSLRPDAVPASVDELFAMRGRGWLPSYSIGEQGSRAGVPLAAAYTWDTGVQVSSSWRGVTVAGAVTTGTLSNPRVRDDNDGRTVALRATLTPATGLEFGASFSRGRFLERRLTRLLAMSDAGSAVQQAHGVDLEFSRGHLVVSAEAVASEWRLPIAGRLERLRALGTSGETRYAVLPGVYAAARVEHLAFNRLHGVREALTWDAPVTRLEIGGGVYVRRNATARVSWQLNERDGGRVRRARFVAAQLLYWF